MSINFKEPKTFNECLERLKAGCQKLSDECDYSSDYSIFNTGATEEQLKRIESHFNVKLCEDYREFMKFSNGAKIKEHSAIIYGTEMFGVSDPMVPDGYLTIGEVVGDGERIAISKADGEIYSFYNGKMYSWDIYYQMEQFLKDCEDLIEEYEKQLIRASKDPEILRKEAEECTSYWRKLIEEKKKERRAEND